MEKKYSISIMKEDLDIGMDNTTTRTKCVTSKYGN